jgi:predicted amidohydrolase
MAEVVKVACCQIAPSVSRARENVELTRTAIRDAVAAGAQLVVLPELCSSGYVFESVEEARAAAEMGPGVLDAWAAEAADGARTGHDDVVVVGGFCELGEEGRVYNSCALVDRTGVRAVYRKVHLWDREAQWFSPGCAGAPVVETALGRIGLAVCYDLEFPELTRGLALQGAELIALPANWPRDRVDREMPILALLGCSTAYLNKVFVAVCDRCGTERGLEFEGGSVIAGPDGRVLAGGGAGEGALRLVAECEMDRARDKANGDSNDAFADRRPDLYPGLHAATG